MARQRIELKDYGLLLDPNICRMLVQLAVDNPTRYQQFSVTLFKWIAAGCPTPFAKHIPSDLDLMAQSLLERIFQEHIGRWRTYNAHKRG